MPNAATEWRTNLRANLRLWPEPVPNIAALAEVFGQVYNEEQLVRGFPVGDAEATGTRSVRNTFEALALAGLAYRESDPGDRLLATGLGRAVFTFLGTLGDHRFANDRNRAVLADPMIRGLSVVIEYRAIWMLMRRTGNVLTNEELNRAMARIASLDDVSDAAERVNASRRAGDTTQVGPRAYEDEKYGTANESDQRKAINPLFLLAGGGGLFITVGGDAAARRRLEEWAVPLIDRRLEEAVPLIHASTDANSIRMISEHAEVPVDLWSDA